MALEMILPFRISFTLLPEKVKTERLETIKLKQNNSLSPLLVPVDKTMQTSTQVWKHVLAWPKLIELVHHIRNEIKAKEHKNFTNQWLLCYYQVQVV